jgi:glycosyltransferase involved in cell wall biosynthesis
MTDLSIFLNDLAGGGAERVMINLAEGFAARGYAVDLVLAKCQGPYLAFLSSDLNLIDLAAPRLIRSLPRLVRYLQRARPRALVSALNDANLIAILAGRLARVPTRILVTEHSHVSEGAKHEQRLRRLMPWVVGLVYKHADRVIAVSRGVEADLHRLGVSPQRTRTIFNPIVTPALRLQLCETPDHPWLAGTGVPVIVGIGRLCVQKDFALLIRAFAEVRHQQEARLLILGEGEERPNLERLVRTLDLGDAVALPGFVSNPAAYLGGAAVLAVSSRVEGFGNVLVEALAAGTPVVSTNCVCGPAEILSDGRYGRLVPVGDVQAMAQAILDLLTGPPPDYDLLRRRAEDFALSHILDQYLEACFD